MASKNENCFKPRTHYELVFFGTSLLLDKRFFKWTRHFNEIHV